MKLKLTYPGGTVAEVEGTPEELATLLKARESLIPITSPWPPQYVPYFYPVTVPVTVNPYPWTTVTTGTDVFAPYQNK